MIVLERSAVAAADALAAPALRCDLTAVADNARRVLAATGTPLLAVVKADGFGHGATAAARTALAAGATWLGTATLPEAVALRRDGIAAPVLCWLHAPGADWATALRLGIDLALASTAQLTEVARAAARTGRRARVHLHVDVGLARDGAPEGRWAELVDAARAAETAGLVAVVGVMGHLPCPEEAASTDEGVARFEAALGTARALGVRPAVRHLAATQAALTRPDTRYDLVRVGAGLYGIGSGLRPALTLRAPVVLTRRVAPGTPVGYGHAHVTTATTTLALLPLGYADGIPRALAPGAAVQLAGRRCLVVGRVSMDQLVVDAGPAGVPADAVATVFGPGADGEPTLDDWSAWAGTIPQELLVRLGARLVRTTTAVPA